MGHEGLFAEKCKDFSGDHADRAESLYQPPGAAKIQQATKRTRPDQTDHRGESPAYPENEHGSETIPQKRRFPNIGKRETPSTAGG